ncbi:hypothetical protein EDD18DRAFT_1112661 [Armillaria luteobubalina]|uniref:F-box domain-containing protein n=1 Tax=Armillaria luteobubalina TaxID=153913 RepID=A0AA39PE81_9AGAR|nr:hypothetical protein EDD18DRAFT_1112661 [Armillaria luteobubalina]
MLIRDVATSLLFVFVHAHDKYDFKAMDDEVFDFENDKQAGQVLASIVDGSHVYYKYLDALVISGSMEGNPLKVNLYQSLKPHLTRFVDEWQEFNEKFFSSSPFSWDTALSALFMDFPDELKMAVLNVIPRSDLLALHMVNRHLWELITPITHSCLQFQMPPSGWAVFKDNSTVVYEWAAAAEILGAIFIHEAWFPVVSMMFQSWPMNQYCFFNF